MEAYLLELVRQCQMLGYRSVLQYESMPTSNAYLGDVSASGADIVVVPTAERRMRGLRELRTLIRQTKPAVIQTHFVERHVLLAAALLGKTVGTREVACMVHNVHHLTPRSRARYAYNRCNDVLAVSQAVHDDLLAGAVRPELVHTHYLGLTGERSPSPELRARIRAELDLPSDALVIANISFDAPFKGVDVLVRALADVVGQMPNTYLLQLGVDTSRSALPTLASELGVERHIRWAGIRDEGWRFLNAADVYVQPSRFGEGLPLAIMEAMAMRLPVVATRVAGNSEAVVDDVTGVLAEAGQPQALAQALVAVLSHSERWRVFGDAGYTRYRDLFDGQTSVRRLIEQYYRLN
jgi:glycosyltransferase involved in cell wall biosynthesis